ncbi:solute carrier family 52, riboflavin transporter, member 3-A-like [Antedon mediterranea]|uniref:solute carrier family 52, riboflavin transporter, member 3-A-like n=1 Tax=Antedon mediterranea TaxID=105859 RepID=UPI003AF5779D
MEEKPDSFSWPVLFLVMLFGSGTWLAINALWVELPLLVASGVPEGYTLGSYLIVITQAGNLGPFLFTIATYWAPKNKKLEIPVIYILISLASLSTFLMIFFWDVTTYWKVDNMEHSTIMLILTFLFSTIACTTPVTYLPFISRFPGKYLMYYFIGEGFSALLPSIVTLIQGVGEQPKCVPVSDVYTNITMEGNSTVELQCRDWEVVYPKGRFSSEVFFGFLFVMTFISSTSFVLLNFLPVAKKERSKIKNKAQEVEDVSTSTYMLKSNGKRDTEDGEVREQDTSLMSNKDSDENTEENKNVDSDDIKIKSLNLPFGLLGRRRVIYLLVLLGWINALTNSILPSVQTYSCGPYSMQTFHLAAALDNIVMPIVYLTVSFKLYSSITLVSVLTFLCTLAGSYCMLTAAMSPTPPLQFSAAGDVFVILAWMSVAGLSSYVKATIGGIMRSQPNNRRLLLWFGIVTQIGSFVGAVIMFPLVNVFNVFEEYYKDPCEGVDVCVEEVLY